MEKEFEARFDKLAALVAEGFSDLRTGIGALHVGQTELRTVLEKNTHDLKYLDRKLDNRFDLLERMMYDKFEHDRSRIGALEGKVKQLQQVGSLSHSFGAGVATGGFA